MNKPLLSDLLNRLVPLNTLPSRYLQEIRHQLVPRALAPGDVLFDEQTPSGLSYFLLSGTLSLLTPDGERPLVAGSPESCHVIASGVRVSRVCALEDACVLGIDSAQLERLVTWQHANADLLLELATAGELTDWLEALLENPLFAKVPRQTYATCLPGSKPSTFRSATCCCVKVRPATVATFSRAVVPKS